MLNKGMLPYQRNMSFLCQVQPWSWSVAIQALAEKRVANALPSGNQTCRESHIKSMGNVPLPCLIEGKDNRQRFVFENVGENQLLSLLQNLVCPWFFF